MKRIITIAVVIFAAMAAVTVEDVAAKGRGQTPICRVEGSAVERYVSLLTRSCPLHWIMEEYAKIKKEDRGKQMFVSFAEAHIRQLTNVMKTEGDMSVDYFETAAALRQYRNSSVMEEYFINRMLEERLREQGTLLARASKKGDTYAKWRLEEIISRTSLREKDF